MKEQSKTNGQQPLLIRSAVVGQWCVEVTILEQWSKTINLEVTLIEDYKCQILEEINYEKDHDPTHTINETRMDKFKTRGCGCGNELGQNGTYLEQPTFDTKNTLYL